MGLSVLNRKTAIELGKLAVIIIIICTEFFLPPAPYFSRELCESCCMLVFKISKIEKFLAGIPVWVGRKLYSRYEHDNRHKRNLVIAGGVTASVSSIFLSLFLVVYLTRGKWEVNVVRCHILQ